MTFDEALLKAKNFGSGLIEIGVKPYELVGIYCQNRPEWILFEQGAYCYSLVVVRNEFYNEFLMNVCFIKMSI